MFLLTLPLASWPWSLAMWSCPCHVNESTDPVDNLGGILSIVFVAALVLAINFAPVPDKADRRDRAAGGRGRGGAVLRAPAARRHPSTT